MHQQTAAVYVSIFGGTRVTLLCRAQALSQDQVVAAIYETIIRPEQFDRFFDESSLGRPGVSGNPAVVLGASRPSPLLQAHFGRARDIQEAQWRQAKQVHPAEFTGECSRFWLIAQAVEGSDAPSRLVNVSERGARVLGDRQDPLAALGLTDRAVARWRTYLDQVAQGAVPEQQVVLLETDQPGEWILCRPIGVPQFGKVGPAVMAERLEVDWRQEAEGAVATALGVRSEDLQPVRDAIVGTGLEMTHGLVRLAEQSGAPGVAAVIRLAAFLMNEHVRDLRIARGELPPAEGMLEDASGCRSQYFRFGAETGQPVIFVHGVMDGVVPLQRLQPQLRALGFRVYAPLRGGYGASDPVPVGKDPVDAFVQQVDALIAQENLQKPILLSHHGGALFATLAANRLHSRLPGLVSVASRRAINSPGQFNGISGYAWLFAFCSARAPAMLPLLMKGWSSALRYYGQEKLLHIQSRRGSREEEQIRQMNLVPLLVQNQAVFLQQGGQGCLTDFRVLRRGARKLRLARQTRAVFVHGARDRMAPLSSIHEMLSNMNNVQMCVSQEGGALMFYTMPELVLTALQDCAEMLRD